MFLLCGKVCGKLFVKILIIYFIYVIVKSNKRLHDSDFTIKLIIKKGNSKWMS